MGRIFVEPPLTKSLVLPKQRDPQQFGRPIWATFQLCRGTTSKNTQSRCSERRALCANHAIFTSLTSDRPPERTSTRVISKSSKVALRKFKSHFFATGTRVYFWRRGVACFFNVRTDDVFGGAHTNENAHAGLAARSNCKNPESNLCPLRGLFIFIHTRTTGLPESLITGSPSFLPVLLKKLHAEQNFPLGKYLVKNSKFKKKSAHHCINSRHVEDF